MQLLPTDPLVIVSRFLDPVSMCRWIGTDQYFNELLTSPSFRLKRLYSSVYKRKVDTSVPLNLEGNVSDIEAYIMALTDRYGPGDKTVRELRRSLVNTGNKVAMALSNLWTDAMKLGEYYLSPLAFVNDMLNPPWDPYVGSYEIEHSPEDIRMMYRYLRFSVMEGNVGAHGTLIEFISKHIPEQRHEMAQIAQDCLVLGGPYYGPDDYTEEGDEEEEVEYTISDWEAEFQDAIEIYQRLAQYCYPWMSIKNTNTYNQKRGCMVHLKNVLSAGFLNFPYATIEDLIVTKYSHALHTIPLIPRFLSKRFSGKGSNQPYKIPMDTSKSLKYSLDILRCPLPSNPEALRVYTSMFIPDLGMLIRWDPSVIGRLLT